MVTEEAVILLNTDPGLFRSALKCRLFGDEILKIFWDGLSPLSDPTLLEEDIPFQTHLPSMPLASHPPLENFGYTLNLTPKIMCQLIPKGYFPGRKLRGGLAYPDSPEKFPLQYRWKIEKVNLYVYGYLSLIIMLNFQTSHMMCNGHISEGHMLWILR